MLSRYPDGSFRSAELYQLRECAHIAIVRFNRSLFFANVNHLESKILELIATRPHLRHILISCSGINELDASGEHMLSSLVDRIRGGGYGLSVCGLNELVASAMKRTALLAKIGETHLHYNVLTAVEAIYEDAHRDSDERDCPLRKP